MYVCAMRLFSTELIRARQNVVRTSVSHSAIRRVQLFLLLPQFDVICDQLLNRDKFFSDVFITRMIKKLTESFV